MEPTYHDGERLLALYGWQRLRLRPGTVVVVRAPAPSWTADQPIAAAHRTLIKRVSRVADAPDPDGRTDVRFGAVYVEGDALGYDSTTFGALPRSEVLGRVLVRRDRRQRPT